MLITFEGGEGVGKTTQVRLLEQRLALYQRPAISIREPGGTPPGEKIREIFKDKTHILCAEAELMLLCASRAQLVREVIRPALAKHRIVICDRFHDSTIAYQAYGRGLDMEFVKKALHFTIHPTWPDLTFYLDLAPEEAEKRISHRADGRDRMEMENRAFFHKVRTGFYCQAKEHAQRIITIDASAPIQEVESIIWEKVQRFILSKM